MRITGGSAEVLSNVLAMLMHSAPLVRLTATKKYKACEYRLAKLGSLGVAIVISSDNLSIFLERIKILEDSLEQRGGRLLERIKNNDTNKEELVSALIANVTDSVFVTSVLIPMLEKSIKLFKENEEKKKETETEKDIETMVVMATTTNVVEYLSELVNKHFEQDAHSQPKE